MHRWTGWIVVFLSVSSLCSISLADRGASKHLNSGIHAFRQGRYFDAISQLDLASSFDAQDSRIYFFRGLAKDRLGQRSEAESDYQRGAQLEVMFGSAKTGGYLHRIQGGERARLESYRREAKKIPAEEVATLREDTLARLAEAQSDVRATDRDHDASKTKRAPVNYSAFATLPADSSDPFADETDGFLLGRGVVEPAEQLVQADALAGPTGSGIASNDVGGTDAEIESDAGLDDFASDDDFGDDFGTEAFGGDASDETVEAETAPETAADTGKKKPSVFGAALRAFGRSVTPSVNIQLPVGGGPGMPGPPGAMPGGPEGADMEMDDDFGGDDFGSDDFEGDFGLDDDGEDPFVDDPL